MSLEFWLHIPFFHPDLSRPYKDLVSEVVDMVQAAEDLGFEGVVVPENNFNNFIVNPSSLQFIGLLAGRTSRIRFLSGVLVLPTHNPLILAGQVALADHMTDGRLSVGVARGGGPYMGDRLGFDGRLSREMYEESLAVMKRLWTEYDVSHDGRFWSFPETTVLPRPLQDPYPELWVAAQTEQGLTDAGRQGLNLLTSPSLGSFAPHGDLDRAIASFRAGSAETGVTPGKAMVMRHMWIDEDDERALEHLDEAYHHWSHYASGATTRPDVENADRLAARDARSGWDRRQRVIRGGRMIPASIEIDRDDIATRYDDPILLGAENAIERFAHYEEIGVDAVACLLAMGAPIEEIIRSMEVIASRVMPSFTASEVPA
ncbi:LLM class flavin-dependent oxidoreductase [Cnuibacter physcomitrellae]|uniref:LLM class flavin-dependent oxidoreductase n=1 Tax=Cnuibacter physcomitrellae TaxID=1619308 RepID=UPI0021760616|nr:LLM class flavin-dependent oxidoreductase [Cnuibacter physcomitrellae]MCS5498281.1 LLM class flavin-dependent oxidoreductase [Cnuibacter physcomitrellae]